MNQGRAKEFASPLAARVGCGVLVAWLLFGDRVTLSISTGGRGAVPVLDLAMVAAGLWTWLTMRRGAMPLVPVRVYWLTVGPLLALLTLLPVLGCFRPQYGPQTLAAVLVVANLISIGVIGRALAAPSRVFRSVGFAVIVGQGLYAVGQTLNQIGLLPNSMWNWANAWDSRSQGAYAADYLISQRSTGFFINPNDFAEWSLLGVVFAFSYLQGKRRWLAVTLAGFGMIGGGSRTAVVALIFVGLLAWAAHRFRVPRSVASVGWPLLIVFGLIASGLAGRLAQAEPVTRLAGIGAVFGVGTDPNLSGRISAWEAAQEVSANYPWGTFGPPQVVVEQSIDNQFIGFFLQGGLLLVIAYIALLLTPWTMQRMGCRSSQGLKAMTIVVAVFSMTAMAFGNLQADALVLLAGVITLRGSEESVSAASLAPPSGLQKSGSWGALTHG